MTMLSSTHFAFMRHVAEYNLSYATTSEFDARHEIFTAIHELMEAENANPENTFTLAHNQFSTWTNAERNKVLGFRSSGAVNAITENNTPNADSVDWNTKGCVTAPKNQASCGSCWAFSTTGSMEGAHCAEGNTLVSLSEQELVDCDTADGNAGCNGGDMALAMKWAETNGLCTESDYAYKGKDGTCKESSCTASVKTTSYTNVTAGSSKGLMASIETAPTSIAIEADKLAFQMYRHGVLNSKKCGTNLDHGVLAVGYGTDSTGQDFYLVKNSWGASWGESGFLRIANNGDGDGICGIQMDAVRATTN